ncbi:MAG: methionine--tRNA ligase [Gammaproteobacteria bacterium]|nr:methionine--tRNA ligase [Gammaproteobacteria bacterium]
MRRILVTAALPYSNGAIHLGHLLEHIQTDIWVRFQKLRGNECYFICAEDTHGTATMIGAEEAGVTPEVWVEELRQQHIEDFDAFAIGHDNYYTTHSPENEHFAREIYTKLKANDAIYTATVEQLYDPTKALFLADRYVRGTCPRCGAEDQPGDNCDNCGATYAATELKNPRSAHTNATPVLRSSTHYFFNLPKFEDFLRSWTESGTVRPEITNKLKEWLDGGMKAWDISRDAPYFGFRIPDTDDKYFYVWLDAPMGYMASFQNWCDRAGINFDDFWNKDSQAEVHHFIGKDIVNFHALFWPAVLHCAGYRTPTSVRVHGMITVNGEKMSKSRGTFINASTFREVLDPDTLRYYYGARLNASMADIDVSFEDFVSRVNSDLIGKFVNIPSRCANFLQRHFDSILSTELVLPELYEEFAAKQQLIEDLYEEGETSKVVREVMTLADRANQYIANNPPWELAKTSGREQEVQAVCTMAINLFRTLCVYLKPIIPGLVSRSEQYLNVGELKWIDAKQPLLGHQLTPFKRLMSRIDIKQIDKIINASRDPSTDDSDNKQRNSETIELAEFQKVDLRVAQIENASVVEGADKLLKLELKVGTESRTVFAGIRSAYEPADLIGRFVVVVANLKPRKMRFGISEGMVLAAGPGDKDIFLLSPDEGAVTGMEVS